MSETPHKPQETPQPTPPQHEQPKRLCDYCNDRRAVLYCRADSAKLCFSCDREVHSTNQLFSKHSRSQLCDICGDSPASIFCETEQSVLCSNCDWENHTTLYVSPVHNRRPIESFNGCPSVTELLTFVGFDDLDDKALFSTDEDNNNYNYFDGDGLSEYFDWEANDFVSIDNLIVPSDAAHNYQALDVPSLPKNRNATCGQQKEEMLRQLRQLSKLEPNYNYENVDTETVVGFRSLVPELDRQPGNLHTGLEHDAKPISFPDREASAAQWFTDSLEAVNQLPSSLLRNKFEESSVVPDQHLETGGRVSHSSDGHKEQSHHPDPVTTETVPVLPKFGLHELNSQERDSAISRYKEKRKTRRYDKHIRYESRKVRAESRTRIKGRFAKLEQ
ncbi:hypothetical protein Q3G72_027843 [Acer saccharum]|nr:hypothetical protein Q3G72_027843 [Acer saccharum]